MKALLVFVLLFVLMLVNSAFATPNWSEGAPVPAGGRADILELGSEQGPYVIQGKLHAQIYPVSVTGVLPPYRPIKKFIDDKSWNPLKALLHKIVRGVTGFKTFDSMLVRLGLHEYPKATETGIYEVPYPDGERPTYRMGFGLLERDGAKGFSFSCAACHTSELFGKKVLGMTNRFPRANEFFVKAHSITSYYNSWMFEQWTGANHAEVGLMDASVESLRRVGVKDPLVLGLDTSLAQVALSLNRRNLDSYATPSRRFENHPRADMLDHYPADSKPSVWWNVKYKNRWLSDGSVVSGNPIFTNLIWNEIGRGVDLKVLENWLAQNEKIVAELTATVFASEAPVITDFYPAEKIDIGRAKSGEFTYNLTCARCHGRYEKAWSLPNANSLSLKDQLKTVRVVPRAQTPVEEVGTDPYRRWGMKSLEQLNDLSISKTNQIVIKPQVGYVPPPLVGIWARWPYMHNNSIPNLCALLTGSRKRPVAYYAGEAIDPAKDFDFACNGYPLGDKTPKAWMKRETYFDTTRLGMSNSGHDEGIITENGQELLSREEKQNLILYLQTL
jgi:cytochrome c5